MIWGGKQTWKMVEGYKDKGCKLLSRVQHLAEQDRLVCATKLKEAGSYIQSVKQKPTPESMTTVLNSQLSEFSATFELQNNISP